MSLQKLHLKREEAFKYFQKVMSQIENISKSSMQILMNAYEYVEYEKNTIIIKENDTSGTVYFIVKGLVKSYYYNTSKELIDSFSEEGTFFGNLYSHITKKPATEIYEAMEDVVLLKTDYVQLERLFKEHHDLETLARKGIQQYYVQYMERVHQLKGLTADEKYNLFLEQYGSIMNRIPIKSIADYLGISAETLSRIRAKEKRSKKDTK